MPGLSWVRFSMVRARDPRLRARPSVPTLFVRFIPGMLVVLFFKCMAALLKPIHHRGDRVKWGLVAYTAIVFSLVTVYTAMNLHIQSTSFIDNREYPGVMGEVDPGPYGYFMSIYYKAINIVPNAAFCLNNWLADGLLVSFLFDSQGARSCLTPTLL